MFVPLGRSHPTTMASSDVQQALPSNGHVDGAPLCDVETTSSNPVEPRDRPEHEEQVRSAQPGTPEPPAAASEKHNPPSSPTKRPTLSVHPSKGASGPPTPQVKKVLSFFPSSFCTLFLTRIPRIADFKLGQVRLRCHQGCSTSNLQARGDPHFCKVCHRPSSPFYLEAHTLVQPHCVEEIHFCTVFKSNHATETVNRYPFRSGLDT